MTWLKEWAGVLALGLALAGAVFGGLAWMSDKQADRMERIEGRLTERLNRIEAELVMQGKELSGLREWARGIERKLDAK